MIVSLTGSNEYIIESELKSVVSTFKAKNGDIAIEQIDGAEADYQHILESASNLSLLSPNRLVVVRRGATNKSFMESFEDFTKAVPETNEIVIVEPNIDKRLSYYKSLKKLTDFREHNNLEINELIKWIVETVAKRKGNIKSHVAKYLVDTVGIDQMRISNEITKLINYQSEITEDSINLLVDPLPQATVFQLIDAAFAGRNQELVRIYNEQKRQKVEPQQIIAMLAWQLHILAIIKASAGKSPSEIVQATKMNPFVINKSFNMAKKLSLTDVKSLISRLLELDIKLKNKNIDGDAALLQLLLSIGS